MRDQILYLKDIQAAIAAIEKFVEGIDFEQFRVDDKTSSAVIRKLEIIGAAPQLL
ncbi:MAG TPA: HepT-like ribonuclease domain-containing protein [Dissulfurispiraceae bacterium]|nr:HepT-like ribonuclease domain-containing protein [Dissulfurispiraceae bacterium]